MKKWLAKAILFIGVLTLAAGCGQKQSSDNKTTESNTSSTTQQSETKVAETHLVNEIKETDFFVNSEWVQTQLDSNEEQTVVLETSYGEGESYKKGHLLTAIHMDTLEIETEENNWNILDAETCKQAFLSKGITKDTTLIVYSEDINAASRIAFVAYWLGVDHVKILDGGLAAWEAANCCGTLEETINQGTAKKDFGVNVPARPEILIGTSDDLLVAKKKNSDLVLASTRSWDEFIGKTSGYNYIENAGEPYGAVYAKSSKSSSDIAYLVNEDGTLVDPEPIFKEWQEWGIEPDKQVAFYCGTGWRAATVFFICKQKGWENVQLFDGGWYDWDLHHQKDPEKYPVQVGDPRDKKNFVVED